jgi:hypothetical protein
LGKAYARSATIEVAVNEFRKTAVFTFQPNVFRDHDFATKTIDVVSSLGVPEEHSTSFVMLSDITPVSDFQRPSTSGNTASRKGSACLVTGSPHQENCLSVLRNSPRQLLGKLVDDRLLQLANHTREERSMNQVQVVRTKKKRRSAFPRMTKRAMTMPNVHIATRTVQKTRKAKNGCGAPSVSIGTMKVVQVTALPTPNFSALSV